jgi:sugar lactone lactonase YvrE
MPAAELLLDIHAELAEGPVWLEATNEFVWVDIEKGDVHWLDPATGADRSLNVGTYPGAALPDRAGGLVLAVPGGLSRLEAGAQAPTPLVQVEDIPDMRMNDAVVDRRGRIWVGSLHAKELPDCGFLYRVDPDLGFERVLDTLTVSNGIDWSLDNSLMYFIDSPTRRVDVLDYDIETGKATDRRPFFTFGDDLPGMPDGMCVDAEGGLWVALWGGSRVVGITSDGQVHTQIDVPSSQVTSVAFGGPDLRTLLITSATIELPADVLAAEPHGGGLFTADVGVAGLPPTLFAG